MRRRQFIRNGSVLAAGMAVLPSGRIFAAGRADRVRLGFIGTGLRGQNHLANALRRSDVEVVAICDIDETMLGMTRKLIQGSGRPMPEIYTGDNYAYRKLLERKDIDGVVIATPWEWHKVMGIDTMEAGKYCGMEVIMGDTVKDIWDVVKTYERTRTPYMMLENVCYRRDVMAILNMVRKGMFGEMVHLQGGYQHDLRHVKFNDGKQAYGGGVEFGEKGFSEARWRTNHSLKRNGDLYPTHGIGPIGNYINLNRGNRFTKLTSYATRARGLHEYIVKKGGADHPNAGLQFKLGDVVTTQIACANGESVILQHDTNLPRPYSLGFRVQGTRGIWMDVNKSLYLEGISKTSDQWEAAKPYLEEHDHPLWKKWIRETENAGHGGMDFFVLHAFIESIKRKVNTPMDVYDAAAWCAITPLSETSIAKGNKTMDFPDFTRGGWMNRKPDFAMGDEY